MSKKIKNSTILLQEERLKFREAIQEIKKFICNFVKDLVDLLQELNQKIKIINEKKDSYLIQWSNSSSSGSTSSQLHSLKKVLLSSCAAQLQQEIGPSFTIKIHKKNDFEEELVFADLIRMSLCHVDSFSSRIEIYVPKYRIIS